MVSTVREPRGGGQPCLRDCLVDNCDGHPLDCSSQADGAAVQIRQLLAILYPRHPLFNSFLPCHHQAPGGRPWDDGSIVAPVSAYRSIQSTSRKSSAAKLAAMRMQSRVMQPPPLPASAPGGRCGSPPGRARGPGCPATPRGCWVCAHRCGSSSARMGCRGARRCRCHR